MDPPYPAPDQERPIRARRHLITAAAAAALAAGSASAAPMVVLYGTPETNRKIIRPGTPAALPVDGRLYIQEPNWGHLFAGDADRPYRLARVTDDELLAARTAPRMVQILRAAIDRPDCFYAPAHFGCRSHLVFVDEIDHRFAERAPNLNTAAWRGRTSRSQPKRPFPNYVPRPRVGQPGHELGQAMQTLAGIPYPGGGTYAGRVHLYLAPGVVTSIGVGRGKYHNLGRDGRPHLRSYEGIRPALRHGGGLWLEMYHFDRATRTRYPFNTYEWTVYPWRVSLHATAPGARAPDPAITGKIHFMMTRGRPKAKGGAPAACRGAAPSQGCQFALAGAGRNAPFLANGVGQYRMDGDEAQWRAHVRRLYFR